MFVSVGFGLPETARSIVGNGDVKATGWGKSWWSHLRGESKTKCNAKDTRSMSETLDEKDRGAREDPVRKPSSRWPTRWLHSVSFSGKIQR